MKFTRTGLAIAAAFTLAAGCAGYREGSAGGNVISPADAANTAVLQVRNLSTQSLELRAVALGQSRFIGSVGANDTTSILLDPSYFPTGNLYIIGIPPDGSGRAVAGPLAAGKGDKIQFTIEPALDMSRAIVIPRPH
ncbi:MAG TPA: hypothetical protein VHB25_03810 [Gemmatimonadaceae bacterium]|nr:hypothetical protein [Gemmatimonadaceae bacterium]